MQRRRRDRVSRPLRQLLPHRRNGRQEPDIYGGKNLDQNRPRWIEAIPKEGDEEIGEILELDPKDFPPGTQIIVKEPFCPKCGEIYENCVVGEADNTRDCNFDWYQ